MLSKTVKKDINLSTTYSPPPGKHQWNFNTRRLDHSEFLCAYK